MRPRYDSPDTLEELASCSPERPSTAQGRVTVERPSTAQSRTPVERPSTAQSRGTGERPSTAQSRVTVERPSTAERRPALPESPTRPATAERRAPGERPSTAQSRVSDGFMLNFKSFNLLAEERGTCENEKIMYSFQLRLNHQARSN